MTWFGLPENYLIAMGIWLTLLLVAPRLLLKLRRAAKEKPRRKKLANLLLSVWLLLLLLTSLEFGFAFLYDSTDSFNLSNVSQKWFHKYAEPDEKALIFGPNEGVVYRDDREIPESIPTNQRHVCFLGDSFTYGHGVKRVEDRFSNRVRAALEAESPGEFVVSNLGKPGTDLFWGEATLEGMFARGIPVDVAVYTICLNDIESFHPAQGEYYQGYWRAGSDFFLFRDTYFFNLLYFRIRQFQRPEVRTYYDFVREYYEGEPWKKMEDKLLEIEALCREHDCQFRIAIFPFLHNLEGEYSFAFAHDKIARFCEEQEIPVIDLLPVLKLHASQGLTVSPFDAHPNERANHLAADALRERLLSDLFEPTPPVEASRTEKID